MAMGDSSVSLRKPSEAKDPIANPLNNDGTGLHRVHNTPDGLRGVDFN